VRGGGESGKGRSSGAGALIILDCLVGRGKVDDEAVVDSGSSDSIVDAPMSNVMGCALTNNEVAEPDGSENGSVVP
jgi:hypothetical protein